MPADELDDLLNAALSAYSCAEPRAGLSQRVLANARAIGHRRVQVASWFALVAGACASVTLLLLPSRAPELLLPKPVPIGFVIPEDASGARPTARAGHVVRKRRRSLPKLEEFPRRQPLSDEERWLVVLSKKPELARRLLEPGEISEIKPIEIPELYASETRQGDGR